MSKKSVRKKDNITILLLIIGTIITIFAYLLLGPQLAIVTALSVGILIGITKLLKMTQKNKKKRKILNIFLMLFLMLGILMLGAFFVFLIYIKISAEPKFKTAKLNTKELSILYDKDEKEFARLGSEKREKISYNELPEVLVDAIISTEDSRFFQHNGLDAPRFLKAVIGQVMGKSEAGGASTLSMQVVKNSFTDAKADSGIKGIIRKFEDIYLAVFKLEKNYSKEEIIEFYVNNHFLGGNIYGVEEAAQTYFGKSVRDLNLSEAAILAGMFKSPNYYRPNVNPINAGERRKTVLYLMRMHGYITEEEEKIANSIPVNTLTAEEQPATANKYQGYIDTVVDEVKTKYKVNPYTTSLKIYTNLDRARQDAVNSVLNGETYSWINDRVQTGVSVLESETGKLLAIGNGRNINGRSQSNLSQLNYATDIKRQPGSTAKPLFDYGPGIEYNNWSTYELFGDQPYKYSNGQSIKNWDGRYMGTITLRKALSASRNIPALKAFQKVDNKKIIEFVTNLGIKPEIENGKIHEAHSIGAFTGVNPVQMSAAYAAFSNGGYYNEPYTVSKIIYRSNKKVQEHKENKTRAMSDATAYMISSVLQDVSLTDGTPKNVACKTGTTNFDEATMQANNMPGDAIRDSWVVGYSTKTTIGMWYGYDEIDKDGIYVLRNLPATVQKDRLFTALVNSGAMESKREEFKMPTSVVKVAVSVGSNPPKKAGPGGRAVYEYFKKGHEPSVVDTTNYSVPAPSNFGGELNTSTGVVSLHWNAVNPPTSDGGEWGYNIYLGNELIDWTSATSYSFKPNNPFGVYKVIAAYKGLNSIQSSAAMLQIKEQKEEPKQEEKKEETPVTQPEEKPEEEKEETPTT